MRTAGARSMTAFAEEIGVDRREVYRWRDAGGVTDVMADRLAVRFGRTPGEVWPDWFDVVDAEPPCETGRDVEAGRAYAARWRAAHPDEVAEYQARYRQLNADAKARYSRSYYRRHRESMLAKQRERDRVRRERSDAA